MAGNHSGRTGVETDRLSHRWTCVFNILPLMLALLPTRVGDSGNWAGAVMFIGLSFLL